MKKSEALILLLSYWLLPTLCPAAEPQGAIKVSASDNDGWASCKWQVYRYRTWSEAGVQKEAWDPIFKDGNGRYSPQDFRGTASTALKAGRYRIEIRHGDPSRHKNVFAEDITVEDRSVLGLEAAFATASMSISDRGKAVLPDIAAVTSDIQKQLGLPIGAKGVFVSESLRGLPPGIVIESIFHRSVATREEFLSQWNSCKTPLCQNR